MDKENYFIPIPKAGKKTLLNRTFFNKKFLVHIKYCSAGWQLITRNNEYTHHFISFYKMAPFRQEDETYEHQVMANGIIFFGLNIMFLNLDKIKFEEGSKNE